MEAMEGKPDLEQLSKAAIAMAGALGIESESPEELLDQIKETLRKYWQFFLEKIITDLELRNVVVARYPTFLVDKFGISIDSLAYFTPELQIMFDTALFGRPSMSKSLNA